MAVAEGGGDPGFFGEVGGWGWGGGASVAVFESGIWVWCFRVFGAGEAGFDAVRGVSTAFGDGVDG